jgi:glycine/D-amino acid oxidase-like deaminating enzyme
MKLVPYWLDTAPAFAGGAPALPERADVVVIGGGITGLSAALALAKKGAEVVVCEKATVGHAASGRNGGMCNNGFAIDPAGAVAMLGVERAKAIYKAYDAGVDTVERIVREEGIDCSFRRAGKLKLAYKAAHYDKLAHASEVLNKNGIDETTLVPKSALKAEIGTPLYHGGLLYPKSAGMHVGKYVIGLAQAAARRGAQIVEHCAVTGLAREKGGHVVTTTSGFIRAKQVLLAGGSVVSGPFGWFRRRFVQVGSFIVVTEPLKAAVIDDIMPTRRMITDSKNLSYYFRMTPEDRLMFGGRARFAMSSPTSDAKSGAILEAAMLSVFPQLRGVRLDYCWGGLVDMTRDRLPRAGERDGLFYSMGYSGHGTQMATQMGVIMAEVMNGRPEANIWRDFAWPAIPGHFGTPWFLPFVGAYYRMKDAIA